MAVDFVLEAVNGAAPTGPDGQTDFPDFTVFWGSPGTRATQEGYINYV